MSSLFLFRTAIELDNIASPTVRGSPPTDAFWRTIQLGVRSPVPIGFTRLRRAKPMERVDSRVPPLVRQNKVGGGQAPDQPERPDRSTEKKIRINTFFVNCYLSHSPGRACNSLGSQAGAWEPMVALSDKYWLLIMSPLPLAKQHKKSI